MSKKLKLLNIKIGKTRETEPFSFKEVLQLRDGIEIIKNPNNFFSSKLQLTLKNLNHKGYLN